MTEEGKSAGGIPIFSWFDEPIKQSVNAVFKSVNEGVESLDLFRKFRHAQLGYVREQTMHVKILGMAEPQLLPDIYTAATLSNSIARRLYRKEQLEDPETKDDEVPVRHGRPAKQTVNAEEFIESHLRTIILGGPGSGKTTLLKHLALSYADSSVFQKTRLKYSLLPIFVYLPAMSAAKSTIDDWISAPLVHKTEGHAKAYLKRAMEKGLAVLLLDSLDEVPVQERDAVLHAISETALLYPELKIIVTCRAADYKGGLESFTEAEIARLTQAAVYKVIRAWFIKDPAKGEQLVKALKTDRGVTSLTETPLLLSLLCIQFGHDFSLPKRKAELYRRCVDTLLRDWDATRRFRRESIYAQLSDDRKERIFEQVAYYFFTDGITLNFPVEKLNSIVGDYIERFGLAKSDASGVIDEIERHHGILEKMSADSFAFIHTSFQEYFVARTLVSRREEMEWVKRYYDQDNWSGVIEFIVAIQEDPENVLDFLVEKASMSSLRTSYPAMARRTKLLWLLYRCLCAGAAVRKTFLMGVLQQLFDTQIEMSRLYRSGGILPVAVLDKDGVRHPCFISRRRETLSEALQPYRMLANEMILSPYLPYAEYVLKRIGEIDALEMPSDQRTALKLCLIIPLASVKPVEIKRLVEAIMVATEKNHPLQRVLQESMTVLKNKYIGADGLAKSGVT